jgi:hypothetical protein
MVSKPKPAPIPTPKGYRLHFSYNGQQYKIGLIRNQHVAYTLQSRVNQLVIE